MKKYFASVLAVFMVLSVAVCLSSCDWFEEEEETTVKIFDTPDSENYLAIVNNGISEILADKPEFKYDSSVSVGGIDAKRPEGSNGSSDLGTLNSAADYVKNLIMKNKPFNTASITIPSGTPMSNGLVLNDRTFSDEDVYLTEIDAADFFAITDSEEKARNWGTENATDAEGKTITNNQGDVETVLFLADNNLLVNIAFNDVIEEKDEQGKVIKSTAVAPKASTIEKYFGKPESAEAISAQLNKTSDYLLFSNYTYEYADCSLSLVIDLTTGHITTMAFTKSMNITIPVTGTGTFASIGDAQLTMKTTETSSFAINWAAAASSEDNSSAPASKNAASEEAVSTAAETSAVTAASTGSVTAASTDSVTAAVSETQSQPSVGTTVSDTEPSQTTA